MPRTCEVDLKSSNEKKVIKKTDACATPKAGNGSKTKLVSFSYFAPEAHQVSLAGDFNNWDGNSCLLKRTNSGEWSAAVNLKPGMYDYRFIVDGEWRDDPNNLERIPNPYGTINNRVVVK